MGFTVKGLKFRTEKVCADDSFERRQIIVRDGKGCRSRVTVLRDRIATALKLQLARPGAP
jgi:hypothetical protein